MAQMKSLINIGAHGCGLGETVQTMFPCRTLTVVAVAAL